MNILELPNDVYKHIVNNIDNIIVLQCLYICNRKFRNNINNSHFLNHSLKIMGKMFLKYYWKYMKYLLRYNILRDRLDNLSSVEYHDTDSSLDLNDIIDYDFNLETEELK